MSRFRARWPRRPDGSVTSTQRPSTAAGADKPSSSRASTDVRLPAGVLKARFAALLSEQVRPFLKDRGFAKSGSTFRRRRGQLYDVINFQGSTVNGVGTLHRFYVNVGIGSTDVDAVEDGDFIDRPRLESCLVQRRWEGFADGAPERVEILPDSDLDEVAAEIRRWLAEVVTFLDTVDCTDALVDLAIEGNLLHQMRKTCAYLARIDDIPRLCLYVRTLRDRFETETRWATFNRQIGEAVGLRGDELRGAGLLDEFTD